MKEVLVSSEEAAGMLGITTRQLQRMVKQGTIKPHPSSKSTVKNRLFRISDIAAIQEIRAKGGSPEAAFVEARQASMEVRMLRKEVERMRTVLGLNTPIVDTNRDTVMCLLIEAEDELRQPPSHDHEKLLYWARILHALTEAHLEAITFHSSQKEPWKSFLAIGRHLLRGYDSSLTRYDLELNNIYLLLAAGLKSARQVAYFHIRNLYGKEYAAKVMPEVKGCPHEDVIAMSLNGLNYETPRSVH